nr:MAG TPA: hypothetical protein [Caudoviricetes sp.]
MVTVAFNLLIKVGCLFFSNRGIFDRRLGILEIFHSSYYI